MINSIPKSDPDADPKADPKAAADHAAFDQVHVLFHRACMQHADRLAIECGDQQLTYAALLNRVHAIRTLLLAQQLAPGEIVAVYGERSVDAIASAIAVWSIGAILMLIDATLPEQRRNLMIKSVATDAVVLCGAAWVVEGIPTIDLRLARQATADFTDFTAENYASDYAYIAFTSGSTGQPKAILGSHNGLAHFLTWQSQEFAIRPGARFAHFTNLSFDVWFRDVFTPLISGATVCIPTDQLPSAQSVFDFLRNSRITATHLVPSMTSLWMNTCSPDSPIACLTHAFFAGEPLEGVLVRKWRRAFPQCEVVNLYGPTETTLAKHCKRIAAEAAEVAEVAEGVQAVGFNIPGSMTYFLSEDGQLCAPGQTGEICIATPYRSHGYLASNGLVSPFIDGLIPGVVSLPLYRTGDLGRRNQHDEIEILGRKDDQIKINGVRIDLLEVKSVIASHPAAREVFVCARQNRFTKSIVAFIEVDMRLDTTLLEARLLNFLRGNFPAMMIPSEFHLRDSLPRLPNGKIDRKSLSDFANRGSADLHAVPPASASSTSSSSSPPSTAEQIEKIWRDILDHPNLLRTRNFFDVGGNSLLIAVLHETLEKRFHLKIPLVRFFQETTVEAQSQLINQLLGSGAEEKTNVISRAPTAASTPASSQIQSRMRMIAARSRLTNLR